MSASPSGDRVNPNRRQAWLAWSSGKDSLWALHRARRFSDLEVSGLLTTITESYGRVTMHGVRESLVNAQAAALDLPLYTVRIPTPCSESEYESLMGGAMSEAAKAGVTSVIFGDIFLEDLRAHRARQLARVGMDAVFPLWGIDTTTLAQTMIDQGVRAYVTCLDPQKAPRALAGRSFDAEFLERLPEEVDPCGENGEFHTFVWKGPGLTPPISVEVGETVERGGFVFTDIRACTARLA